ncbi:MAG: GspH/FimT family pseudopilin, partial [Anaerolineae bacterium]|nr:GspH/FimT family pseudopilin [Phycisphaerae bacterium]
MILSITMAMAAPSLRGWGDGAKLRNASDQFLAATQWARSRAIVSATKQVLTVDATSGSYVVAPDATMSTSSNVVAGGEFSQPTVMPTSFSIEMLSGGETSNTIAFFPDGRSTPAAVRVTSAQGDSVQIMSVAPTQPFAIVRGN